MLLVRNRDIMLVLLRVNKNTERSMSFFCVLAYFPKFTGQDMFKLMILPGVQENKGKATLLVNLSCQPVYFKIIFNTMQ